ATPDQIRRLMCPGTKDAATIRGGLKDLEAERLVISPGSAVQVREDGVRVTEKLWVLTPGGLEAAAVALDRPAQEMGGTAKAAAASGAKHARAVTEVLTAFLQTPPEATQPVARRTAPAPAPVPAAPARTEQLLAPPPGLGPLAAWSTEVVLPAAGTFRSPARGSLRADMVFASPDHATAPLIFVEVDNGTEGPPTVAAKIERYRTFFDRKITLGERTMPLWRSVWNADPVQDRLADRQHPPVALVFTKNVGQDAMKARMRDVGELAIEHWRGTWHGDGPTAAGQRPDGYRDYDGTVPLLTTTLKQLAEHGPHGPVWWRYGHAEWEPLAVALDNPDDYRAYSVRDQARHQAAEARRERERQEQLERRRQLEAAKWTCPTCGAPVYPDDGLTPGGECRPCLNDRRRAAEAAVAADVQPPGRFFGRRRQS
ncbi:replication-relaxation family protein, partial [Streptomyces sp. NPDC051016]|uniref:replication-relaxation family protein n=1 Tax=Streptomyces sp. NPDC051016 TaxID=3365638 RepID=UPI0037AEFE19